MDQYTGRVRGVVQAAVAAAGAGKLDDPDALLNFDPADRTKTQDGLKALNLGDDPDSIGEQIAAVLKAALDGAPASPPATPAEPAPAQPAPAEAPAAEVKKKELAGAVEASGTPPGTPQNPEPAAQPVAPGPNPGDFLTNVKSGVGRVYNSAWGLFKGLSKRRSG